MPATATQSRSAKARLNRDRLVKANVGLVHFLARRLHRGLSDEAELDELVSAGMIGLMRAADAFEPERGLSFTTYATPRIRGAMLDELRRLDRVPRSIRSRSRAMREVQNALTQRLGRQPDGPEMAVALGVDLETYWKWSDDIRGGAVVALDARGDDEIVERPSLGERIPDPDFDLDIEIDRERERERLLEALKALRPEERTVLALSYFEEMTLQEIALALGVTESGASRIRSRALQRLREQLRERLAA